jgi:hypothetical protein
MSPARISQSLFMATQFEFSAATVRERPRAGEWVRVSTGHQDTENQLPDLEQFRKRHAYDISARNEVSDSAWNGGKDGGEYQRALRRAFDDPGSGKFEVLVVWAWTG